MDSEPGANGPAGQAHRFTRIDVAPAYRQVFDAVERAFMRGDLRPGDPLPSETALAAQLGVNRSTARAGLRLLQENGLARRSGSRRMTGIHVAGGRRTPFGDVAKSPRDVPSTVPGTHAAKASLDAAGLDPAKVDYLVGGNVLPVGRDGDFAGGGETFSHRPFVATTTRRGAAGDGRHAAPLGDRPAPGGGKPMHGGGPGHGPAPADPSGPRASAGEGFGRPARVPAARRDGPNGPGSGSRE